MMTYNIYDVILDARIQKRPGMFIGDVSPNNLSAFLCGYRIAMDDAKINDVSIPPFHEFSNWVAKKFGFSSSSAGWHQMILAMTLMFDPKDILWEDYDRNATRQQLIDATRRCFELIEEFRNTTVDTDTVLT
jgi:hypothetical protein